MSSTVKVSLDNLDAVFSEILDNHKETIDALNKKNVSKVGRDVAQNLQNTSPADTGDYARGWKSYVEDDSYGGTVAVVAQSKKPSLTHLLEFGHGGPQPAKAHAHIAPAYQKGKAELLEAIRK